MSPKALMDEATTAPGAIRRILLTSTWFGALVALAAWAYLGPSWAVGIIGGALVGAANLVFLTGLTREIIALQHRNKQRIFGLLAIKIIVVYGGLAGLLLWNWLPALAVVGGFAIILLVITLKAAGRALIATGIFRAQTKENQGKNA